MHINFGRMDILRDALIWILNGKNLVPNPFGWRQVYIIYHFNYEQIATLCGMNLHDISSGKDIL